jgi:uncharacterized protein (TIGR02217 family)
MAFLEQRLDSRIEQGASGGPSMPGRSKTYLPGGKMLQTFLADQMIHRFDISHGMRSNADHQLVLDTFYVVMMTPYEGFRFRYWADYRATQTNSRLTLISGSDYQLQRVHTFGGVEVLRNIYKPVSGTVTIYRTRAAVVTTATATLDTATGIATISGHSGGDTYTWEGQFDIPVTFSDDEWVSQMQATMTNIAIVPPSVRLEEIRL